MPNTILDLKKKVVTKFSIWVLLSWHLPNLEERKLFPKRSQNDGENENVFRDLTRGVKYVQQCWDEYKQSSSCFILSSAEEAQLLAYYSELINNKKHLVWQPVLGRKNHCWMAGKSVAKAYTSLWQERTEPRLRSLVLNCLDASSAGLLRDTREQCFVVMWLHFLSLRSNEPPLLSERKAWASPLVYWLDELAHDTQHKRPN